MSVSIDLENRIVSRVALSGRDYRGVNFELLCQPGDVVEAGAAVMRDTRRPEIMFTAPVAGRIAKIERGARRKLISLQIDVDESAGVARHEVPTNRDAASLRSFMLESGAWTSLRTRPFGNIPHPEATPAAIFLTALDAEPQAPQPQPVIEAFMEEFRAAVDVLAGVSDAPLYVCHAPQHRLSLADSSQVRCVPFSGGRSSGLPGTHINALCPIGFAGGEVWHIGYQEAIALGHLLSHGSPWLERVISIGGSAVRNPRSLRVYAGAAISELLADELDDGPVAISSGSAIFGRELDAGEDFLGTGQRQITVQRVAQDPSSPVTSAGDGVLMPGESLEALALPGIYAVPLMRALQLGDAERARELGALELVEEDVAQLSQACQSGCDYGLLLRNVLDQLEALR